MMQRASPHVAQRTQKTATQGQMPFPRHKKRWDKAGGRQPETQWILKTLIFVLHPYTFGTF